ncbi:MAG TPA: hypothetical protein VEC99_04720, partial [Clostridia bacterium]|nr:hypothetical protein [Clostridia bacterium]
TRQAWHFPRTDRGAYAGYHPANSREAIAQLKALQAQGAEYLVVPASCSWWLEYYAEFREHLETHAARLQGPDAVCSIYCLKSHAN